MKHWHPSLEADARARKALDNALNPEKVIPFALKQQLESIDQELRREYLERLDPSGSEKESRFESTSDDLKSRIVESAEQAKEFQSQQTKESLALPFEYQNSEEQAIFGKETIQITEQEIQSGPDQQYQYRDDIKGTLSLSGSDSSDDDSSSSSDSEEEQTVKSSETISPGTSFFEHAPPVYSVEPQANHRTVHYPDPVITREPESSKKVLYPEPSAPPKPPMEISLDELTRLYPDTWQSLLYTTHDLGVSQQERGQVEGINPKMAKRLMRLTQYHIILILDDSYSMDSDDTGLSFHPRGIGQLTRGQELTYRIIAMAPLLSILSIQGITIRYLNDQNITYLAADSTPEQRYMAITAAARALTPYNGTPLNHLLWESFTWAKDNNTPSVTYIFSDGEPNDRCRTGSDQHQALCDCLWPCEGVRGILHTIDVIRNSASASFFPMGLMKCTGKNCEWIDKADTGKDMIGSLDDYASESREVQDNHGFMIRYPYRMHLISGLLAPVDPIFDNLDEKHLYEPHELEVLLGKWPTAEEYRTYRFEAQKARNAAWWRWFWGQDASQIKMSPFYMRGGNTLYQAASGNKKE